MSPLHWRQGRSDPGPMTGTAAGEAKELRILILAPTGSDARLTTRFLGEAGLNPWPCRGIEELCAEIDRGCGAIVLAEEVLADPGGADLVETLTRQPKWSEIPLILITGGGEATREQLRRWAMFGQRANVMLLERPFRPGTLVSTLEAALRSRGRQYEVRRLMSEMEELLREREIETRQFDATLSSIDDLAYRFDLEGNWMWANQPLLKIWGRSLEEIVGKSSWDLGYPEDLAERLQREVKEVVATRTSLRGETYFQDAEGVEDYHEYIFSPVIAPDGSVTAVCGTTRLTTERKRAEAVAEGHRAVLQLIAEDEALSRILEVLARTIAVSSSVRCHVAVYLLDPDKAILKCEAFPSASHGDTAPPDLPLNEAEALFGGDFLDGANPWAPRKALLADLPSLPFWSRGEAEALATFPLRSTDGTALGVFLLFYQGSEVAAESHRATLELAASTAAIAIERKLGDEASRRLAAIVESSEDAIISKDLGGRITSWNAGAQDLFGYTAEEIVGQPITVLFPEEQLNDEADILARIRSGVRIDHYETVRCRKDGTRVDVSLTISPVKDGRGNIVGASKIVRDITAERQATRALEQAHERALAASRAKDDFLAALSHELRTPLNPVLLIASEAADDRTLPADIRRKFEAIRTGVEMEARLIDDLLDLTRITHGKLFLDKGPVDCQVLLHAAVETVQSDLDQKRIELTLDLGAEHSWVHGDGVRLQQVLWNVLKNAAKFTPEGGKITIHTCNGNDGGTLQVRVSDTGIGLTPDELANIFESFSQGEHARSDGKHRFGGLGLGLAISRMLVEQHGGTIEAESAGRNRGASFVIDMPALDRRTLSKESPSPEASRAMPRSTRTLRILLVEDHTATRTALEQLLVRRHFEVSGADSLAAARDLAKNATFDLLISDIGLPDGSGEDLMRELRALQPDLPGIALTGYGMEADLARSRDAGFVSHLIKPIRVQALESAIAAAIAT